MQPNIGQVWQWFVDREHTNVFVVKNITASVHEIEVLCEIIEGKTTGTIFQTSICSFNNYNWRFLRSELSLLYEKKS
jgi:hypothetical protein